MRTATIVFLSATLLGCGSKKSGEGLPPATEWGASANKTAEVEPPTPSGPLVPMEGMKPQGEGTLPPGHPTIPDQGGGSEHPPVASAIPPKSMDKLADGRLGLGPYSLAMPEGWSETPTTSDMRAAQFKLGDAELIVYYFGPSGAGSVKDNLDRWVGQFVQADGKDSMSVAKIEKAQILGKEATIVSVSGRFQAMAMPGATDAVDKADQSLLAAITESPSGPYYWKLVGPKATVAANDAKFRKLIGEMKLKS